ncbi:hypothetical protein [Trinickia diaoshuihuensis]|uniref:hypothetical protein n=1 Tax=Trinickia diaoshuihuensis TaxID=2292265 RepID=UPI000E228C80|nr:hypothetical protein [Trinickia diaoshuihuensis]
MRNSYNKFGYRKAESARKGQAPRIAWWRIAVEWQRSAVRKPLSNKELLGYKNDEAPDRSVHCSYSDKHFIEKRISIVAYLVWVAFGRHGYIASHHHWNA